VLKEEQTIYNLTFGDKFSALQRRPTIRNYRQGRKHIITCINKIAGLTEWYVKGCKYSHCDTRTSQRAGLQAAVRAVERIADCHVRDLDIDTYVVIIDSEYLVNGITSWIYKWR